MQQADFVALVHAAQSLESISLATRMSQLVVKWPTKTGHFLKQSSCRIPAQIPAGIGSLMLNAFVCHYKTPDNQ